jgi:hypothetical protein
MCGPQNGRLRSFAKLSLEQREKVLQSWAKSPIPEFNKVCKGPATKKHGTRPVRNAAYLLGSYVEEGRMLH